MNEKDQINDTYESDVSKENIRRVDKRPSSIYSLVIFVLIFIVGYLFYPQISMLVPLSGTKVTVATDYKSTSVTQMLDADKIVLARCNDKGKRDSYVSPSGEPVVITPFTFTVEEVLKGSQDNEFTLLEYGGNGLFEDGVGRKKKFTVTFKDAAEFSKGEIYLLFLDKENNVINGKYGALEMNDNGMFTDATEIRFSLDDIKAYIQEAER